MKSKNIAMQYFKKKDFSAVEIALLVLIIILAIVATFIQGGGPIGLPALLLCIIGFIICRSMKIKDEEIDQLLKKIIQDNKIECSDRTIASYDLRDAVVKKRKDGKLVSPKYYITNITFTKSGDTVFNVYIIDLLASSVETITHSVSGNEDIALIEETINTNIGPKKRSYLKINSCCAIPVMLNDYKTSQLLEDVCNRNEKN